MTKTSFLIALATFPLHLSAQTQRGYVKTIGRPNKPGIVLPRVVIRVKGMINSVLTSEQGEFSISMPEKKNGDEITILNIQKSGYELKDGSILGRPLVFSTKVPLEILMVDQKQLIADRQRIEDNAYRVAERNYQEKIQELERQKSENEISIEKYHQELASLQNKYDKYISLIGEMADRYARTDYDKLDSIDREINICIENGDFDKADSLIHTVFDPTTVLERNKAAKEEIRQRIAFAQSVIDKAIADREAISRDMDYAKRVTILCENLANEYISQDNPSKAVECLENSIAIKSILYGSDSEEVAKTRQLMTQIQK